MNGAAHWARGVGFGLTLAAAAWWAAHERGLARVGVVVFAQGERGSPIVVPLDATPAERRAATALQRTLARAAGRDESAFPISEERAPVPRGAIFVGATRWEHGFLSAGARLPFDSAVGVRVRAGGVSIRAEHRDGIDGAVYWWLERELGAQWFIPGPLGEYVAQRKEWRLAVGDTVARPGFLSRALGTVDGTWSARNGLEGRLEHGHNLDVIFKPDDLRLNQEMAPMRHGARYLPAKGDWNWQPNFLSPAAVDHTVAAVGRVFDADPARRSYSLCLNDSVLFDQSPATLAARGPSAYFRHRPNFSNLVFRFTNAVAERVAKRHPDRWLPAYAYYWCEDVPDFPIARNVVPFLTADRSQWAHPEFAAQDRALIERWCRSGAELVGAYDYYYGAPYFVPRPMVYAVTETIPFMYRAGVRAFYAEAFSHWGLDGPKPWLAAKLLWYPERDPTELLSLYYREYWREAAGPMREFFELCDRTWRELPGPPLWLRYFNDADQSRIYSSDRLRQLRELIEEAGRRVQSPEVRARVALTSAGFSVSEAFVAFADARARVNTLVQREALPVELMAAWREYRDAKRRLIETTAEVRRREPLAMTEQKLDTVLRNQPDGRVAWFLERTREGRAILQAEAEFVREQLAVSVDEVSALAAMKVERLRDPEFSTVVVEEVTSPAAMDWTPPTSAWSGGGEPWEWRRVALTTEGDGLRRLRITGTRNDMLGQRVLVPPDRPLVARVDVRAKVSPGTAVTLVLLFADAQGRPIGNELVHRLSSSAEVQTTELCIVTRTPPNAALVDMWVKAMHQLPDDFAEFSRPSVRVLGP